VTLKTYTSPLQEQTGAPFFLQGCSQIAFSSSIDARNSAVHAANGSLALAACESVRAFQQKMPAHSIAHLVCAIDALQTHRNLRLCNTRSVPVARRWNIIPRTRGVSVLCARALYLKDCEVFPLNEHEICFSQNSCLTAHPRSMSTISSREHNNILMLIDLLCCKTFRSKKSVMIWLDSAVYRRVLVQGRRTVAQIGWRMCAIHQHKRCCRQRGSGSTNPNCPGLQSQPDLLAMLGPTAHVPNP